MSRARRAGRLAAWLVMLATPGLLSAQSAAGDYTVEKSVIAAGSMRTEAGDFVVDATAGQHDSGQSQAGDFQVSGGFWPSAGVAPPSEPEIFRDGFESP